MVNIDDMLQNDDDFMHQFCSNTTVERMASTPAWVLREVVGYLFHSIGFCAAASPRIWEPLGSPQPLLTIGYLWANGVIKGRRTVQGDDDFRFGLCAPVGSDQTDDPQAIHLWAARDLTGNGGVWEDWRNQKLRLANPVALRRYGEWEVNIGTVLDGTGFLERAGRVECYGPIGLAQDRFEPVLQQLEQDPGFITPKAIDTLRH